MRHAESASVGERRVCAPPEKVAPELRTERRQVESDVRPRYRAGVINPGGTALSRPDFGQGAFYFAK